MATGPIGRNAVRHIAINMAIASPKKKQELERQFKINPEVNAKLDAFMQAEPGLVQFVKELPREQLERKFLLRKMQDQEQKQGYSAKVKAWLDKPEQADLVKSIKATISPNMKPEKQEQAILTQAKNYIRNPGSSSTEAVVCRIPHPAHPSIPRPQLISDAPEHQTQLSGLLESSERSSGRIMVQWHSLSVSHHVFTAASP